MDSGDLRAITAAERARLVRPRPARMGPRDKPEDDEQKEIVGETSNVDPT
jgi:hypothetical protein